MKTTVQITVLLLFGILFTVTSCTKDKNMDDENKDWNVLEWTVDGERYKAECEGDPLFGCDPVECQYYHDDKYLDVYGSSDIGGIIIHKFRNLKINDENILNKDDYMKYFNRTDNNRQCREYLIDTTSFYNLNVNHLDTLNKIIIGKFHFTSINECNDTVHVEDGYFKLSYRP